MRFLDKLKYRYLQESYGRRNKKTQKKQAFTRTLGEMESYLEQILGKSKKNKKKRGWLTLNLSYFSMTWLSCASLTQYSVHNPRY